jgi:conjugative relaxase-like TrwC/TraI family protein
MLTLANVNTTQAKTYYKRENYYTQAQAQDNSEWRGRGASQYQLQGPIEDLDAYENIVNGHSPDGKTQHRQKQSHKDKNQRAGVDLTFSAPKSVSLACLVGGDRRVEEAHRIAVRKTVDLIESRYAETRINAERVKTGNLIVAMWHHDTSRELDPHLHTHCLLMNCTQSPDGKWRSLSNEAFYRNKMLLGQIYRNELALECRKLGYEIQPHAKELFEIKGYTRKQIEAFSKRHEQIVKYLQGREIDVNTQSKVWAWRRSRVHKNHEIDRKDMLPYWHEEADLYKIVHPVPALEHEFVNTQEIEQELQAAVDAAIEHCSERTVAFKPEEIEKFVMTQIRPFGIDALKQAIASHPQLIRTFDDRLTTTTALERELATIGLMQQGKGGVIAIAHPEAVKSYLENKPLTVGQRQAVAVAATTVDRFVAWQGVAGAGKTFALKELKALAQVGGFNIKGFAPSAQAAKVLGEELGVEANTVARLLVSKQLESAQPNSIWIVDEAGMLSAKDAHALLQRATTQQARVILVGDTRQLSAVEAGNPFKSLQQAGIKTAYLDESLRQSSGSPDLQKAVKLAAAGEIVAALEHLEQVGRIEQIADAGERAAQIAQEYIKLSPLQRSQTLILAGTHKERLAITHALRQRLIQEGSIGSGVQATKLKALDLTSVQSRYTHYYHQGDVVMPVREYKRLGLHKQQPYVVAAVSRDSLTLSDLSGNSLTVNPMKFRKSVYTLEALEIAVGDRLRWTKNDLDLGRRNGQEFVVTEIENSTATIEYKDGKSERLDLYLPQHLDYDLVSTTYSSQGKTAGRVLISATVDRTVSQQSVYVAISRAKQDLKIYAQDKQKFLESAQESAAQENPRELLIGQVKEPAAAKVMRAKHESSPLTPNQEVLLTARVGETSAPKRTVKQSNRVQVSNSLAHQVKRSPPPVPKKVGPFWVPKEIPQPPPHLEEKHWRELVEGSAIHEAIAARNFRSLEEDPIEKYHEAWEYLFYSDKLERSNTGRLSIGMLNKYSHIEAGGWWCDAGVDSRCFQDLQPGQKPSQKIWGCYKPNYQRDSTDKPGKKIKYEHPPKTELSIFLLDVPDEIAKRIYQQVGVNPSQSDRACGFWYCVWKYNLPIVITEGAKKAACLLSQGRAAIGLPGIYAGYRSKDEHGNQIKARLHEELAVFATPGRDIKFCFDYETRPQTKRNIEIAISRTGSLMQRQGASVSVIDIPGPEKGVDDFIVAQNPLSYEQQERKALLLRDWRERNKNQQHIPPEPPKKLSLQERKARLQGVLADKQAAQNQAFEQHKRIPESAVSPELSVPNDSKLAVEVERNQNSSPVSEQLNAQPVSLPQEAVAMPPGDLQADKQLATIEQLNQLSDRDFLQIYQNVADYFKAAPPPPTEDQKQLIGSEVEQLIAQVDGLWQKYSQQNSHGGESKGFRSWHKEALVEAQQTLQKIERLLSQKEQKEKQLQQWQRQEEDHQNWEKAPRSSQMRSLALVLKLPQMQKRLISIGQAQQLHAQQQQQNQQKRERRRGL